MRWILAIALVLGAAGPAVADPKADRLVDEFLAAFEKARNFTGVVRVFSKKGERTSTMTLDMALEKPTKTSYTILEAPQNRAAEGTKIVWTGERSLLARTRFFGFPLTVSVDIADDRVRDTRGNTHHDLNILHAIEVLKDPATSLRYLGPGESRGRSLKRVEMRSPRLLKGIDREVFGIDDQTKLPFLREMYEGDEVVYRLEVESYRLNHDLPKNAFTLD